MLDQLVGRSAHRRDPADHPHHLIVPVQIEARHGQHEGQRQEPHAQRPMPVKDELVRAVRPADPEHLRPGLRRPRRQVDRDAVIDDPQQRNETEEPHHGLAQHQVDVQLIDHPHDVASAEADRTEDALAQNVTGIGIDEDLQAPRWRDLGIRTGRHDRSRGVLRRVGQVHDLHIGAGHGSFGRLDQFTRGQGGPAVLGEPEVPVQGGVDLAVEDDDRPGHRQQDQPQAAQQAEPPVPEMENGADLEVWRHCSAPLVRIFRRSDQKRAEMEARMSRPASYGPTTIPQPGMAL